MSIKVVCIKISLWRKVAQTTNQKHSVALPSPISIPSTPKTPILFIPSCLLTLSTTCKRNFHPPWRGSLTHISYPTWRFSVPPSLFSSFSFLLIPTFPLHVDLLWCLYCVICRTHNSWCFRLYWRATLGTVDRSMMVACGRWLGCDFFVCVSVC